MRNSLYIVCALLAFSGMATAKPQATGLFCEAFPAHTACDGTAPSCSFCHGGTVAEMNPFGTDLQTELAGVFPENAADLKAAVDAISEQDSDLDGYLNQRELAEGYLPGSAKSKPEGGICADCENDYIRSYRRIAWTVCGEPADYKDFEAFVRARDKLAALQKKLDECLDSENWIGKDGVVWEIGYYKIRPVGSVKSGEDPGVVEIVDYYDDFHLFVWTQIDGHDARDALTADYTVTRTFRDNATDYTKQDPVRVDDGQPMQVERRAGLITTFWNMAFYQNYTAVARVLVAQVFNGYLGIDLSTMQGLGRLDPEVSQFADYDNKGVTAPSCAVCHETIDPMTYPFRNYNALSGTGQVLAGENADGLDNLGTEENLSPLSYSLPRMEYLNQRFPGIIDMPEVGYVLGQRVENLNEWASVVANSDQFAANTVKDYWRVMVGHDPKPEEQSEFKALWTAFKHQHDFDVEAMLRDLIKTRAFSAQ